MKIEQGGLHSFIGRWSTAALLAAICCGAAAASDGEVAEARAGEEQWERVPVVAPGADSAGPAASASAAEELRFPAGTAELSRSTRADLDRLAARLRADSAACQVDIRPVPAAARDPRLAHKRATAVRRYLTLQGISDHRVSQRSAGGKPRCVLVANLG